MNIRILFGHKKEKAMDAVDKIIYDKLTHGETMAARKEISNQFESLLNSIQDYEDVVEKQKYEIKQNEELIKLLCRKVGP